MTAGHATALSIAPPCERDEQGMYAVKFGAWGDGHVLTHYVWSEDAAPDAAWKKLAIMRLIDCRSGKFVLLSRAPSGEMYDLPEAQAEVLDKLRDGDAISLGKFQRVMKRAGVKAKRFSDTDETCTCNAYFPELRGKKNPYRGTNE